MHNSWSMKQALELRKLPLDEISARQIRFLKAHLHHAARAPYYSRMFKHAGLDDMDGITEISDLKSLPLTSRQDLEQSHADFIPHQEDRSSVVDISQTSGSSGRPLSVPFTRRDLDRLAFNEAVSFYGAGIRPGDRVIICVTLDRCFIAGLAYFSGIVTLGAQAVRSGPVHAAGQWELIRDLKPVAAIGVPSMLLGMAGWACDHGIDPHTSGIRTLIAIGEPIRRKDLSLLPLGRQVEAIWGCGPVSTYAATELQTCFCECISGQGGHCHPELSIVEIVDEKGYPVSCGESGEVVVTPMGVEGMPLVRYRTGDIARLFTEPCGCGWNTPRLGPVEGRLSQRLKYRGTTLYPEMIFQALQEETRINACFVEVRASYDLSDHVTAVVGMREPEGMDAEDIATLLQARLRVKPEVKIEDVHTVMKIMTDDGNRKPRNFFDYR